jgi:tRNA threonylcarbamoyladenosine biosynthesis protein TsaB
MILGIDSSDDFISVGLAGPSGIIVSRSSEPKAQNKNTLHGFLSETLAEAGVSLGQIDGVAIAIGPGSFTGLRVGLAAA